MKRNLACIRLGIATRLAYPPDFVLAVVVIPLFAFLVEVLFWLGLFHASGHETIAGYTKAQYATYLLWLLTQLGGTNWRFERTMIAEINSGAVNAILLRPSSFYEYHLGHQLGQKLVIILLMVPVLLFIAYFWDLPLYTERLLPSILMGFGWVILSFTIAFALASTAFFLDNVYNLNNTKNMLLWFFTGELFPLDLFPSPLRQWLTSLPFSCGTYMPAGYLSGRITTEVFLQGFVSLTLGIVFFGLVARVIWNLGLRRYSGTGA